VISTYTVAYFQKSRICSKDIATLMLKLSLKAELKKTLKCKIWRIMLK